MLKVLLLFVLLIAGIVVGPMIAGHQGYVLIQTGQLQYRNQRHGPGDHIDSGDGSAVCH
ncbi:HemY protein [Escherichia coli]|uniref:HemY protein n=1 Tax=Escherichia coli TaxID=562 RepID=A0A2X1J7W6_ECOLX|nr:HemY protein [Escherichia coli]